MNSEAAGSDVLEITDSFSLARIVQITAFCGASIIDKHPFDSGSFIGSDFAMPDLFNGARLKIEWADHHISDLERQLSAFTRESLDASVRYRDDGKLDITLTVIPPPPYIALVIGDAVHNLWSALDHLMWEVIGLDGGCQHAQLYFPKGRDRASYKGLCNGIKTPSGDVKLLFQSLEAFPGGDGHFLYVTHRLDNADKHTVLTPVVHAPTIDELVLVSDGGQVRRRLSDLYGSAARLHGGETFTIVQRLELLLPSRIMHGFPRIYCSAMLSLFRTSRFTQRSFSFAMPLRTL